MFNIDNSEFDDSMNFRANEPGSANFHIVIKSEDEGDQQPPQRKRKPRTPLRDLREWSFDETKKLCALWRNETVIYDVKHPKHPIKEERDHAVKRIAESLTTPNTIITESHVLGKMASLRAYYSGQLSRIKRSMSTQNDRSENVYQSQWKFIDDLDFLTDVIIPRNKSSIATPNTTFSVPQHPRNQVSSENSIDSIMEHQFINDVSSTSSMHVSPTPNVSQLVNADEAFCEMIRSILLEIPSGEIKDMLKLKIHQQVLEAKYKALS